MEMADCEGQVVIATQLSSPSFVRNKNVKQTLHFGGSKPLTDPSHLKNVHNQHSNSLRSEMFQRHIKAGHISKEHENMVVSDSENGQTDSSCNNNNIFTISPLVHGQFNGQSTATRHPSGGSDKSHSHSSPSYYENSIGLYNKPANSSNSPSFVSASNSSPSNYSLFIKSHHAYKSPSTSSSGHSPVLFKTPGRDNNSAHSSSNVHTTPKDCRIPSTYIENNKETPATRIFNPFDDGIIEKLNLPAFSPSTFTVLSTPSTDGKAPKPFRWSIDQIAALNPADIDEMPHHQEIVLTPDREMEERAQKAIDQYFSNNLIVPSPWNSNPKPFTLPSTPTAQVGCMMSIHVEELKGSIQKELCKKQKTQEVSCQTVLSLPNDVDVFKLLEQYMTFKSDVETNSTEELSTSSLRRKLFFQGDGNTSFSPVRLCGESVPMDDGHSPVKKHVTPEWERKTPLKTPSSAHFASSPINTNSMKKFSHLRRTSEAEFMASPELSPINRRHSGLRRSRSSGEFAPMSSLCTSPIDENYSDQDYPPLPSPNMSPIRKELGASYLPDNECSDESTPHASNPRSCNSKGSQFTLSPQFQTIDATNGSPLQTEATAMETESFKPCYAMGDNRDFSITDMETTNDNAPLPNSTNQDTGYQTASLHTNLTNQFSSLPLKTETSIDPNDLGDSFDYIQSITSSGLDLENEGTDGMKVFEVDSMLCEDRVLSKGKHALEMVTSLYPDSLDVSLNPVGSSTPTKGARTNIVKQKLFAHHRADDKGLEKPLGSEVAMEILKRAGEELARYSAPPQEIH